MSDTQFWVTVGLWNLIVFSMYGYDKLCAIIPVALLWSVYAVGFGYGLWVN